MTTSSGGKSRKLLINKYTGQQQQKKETSLGCFSSRPKYMIW